MVSHAAWSDGVLVTKLNISSGRPLGCGAFAAVHRGTWDGRPCAVKVLLPRHANKFPQSEHPDCPAAMLRREGDMLIRHPHSFLPHCYAILELSPSFPGLVPGYKNRAPALILELLEHGSLFSLLRQQMVSPWIHLYDNVTALSWSIQVASVLVHLHELSPGVIHRDVKAENVILSGAGGGAGCGGGQTRPLVAKLVDLGLHVVPADRPSQDHHQLLFRAALTPLLSAPRPEHEPPPRRVCPSASEALRQCDAESCRLPTLGRVTYLDAGRAPLRRCHTTRLYARSCRPRIPPLFFSWAPGSRQLLPVDPRSPGIRDRHATLIAGGEPVRPEAQWLLCSQDGGGDGGSGSGGARWGSGGNAGSGSGGARGGRGGDGGSRRGGAKGVSGGNGGSGSGGGRGGSRIAVKSREPARRECSDWELPEAHQPLPFLCIVLSTDQSTSRVSAVDSPTVMSRTVSPMLRDKQPPPEQLQQQLLPTLRLTSEYDDDDEDVTHLPLPPLPAPAPGHNGRTEGLLPPPPLQLAEVKVADPPQPISPPQRRQQSPQQQPPLQRGRALLHRTASAAASISSPAAVINTGGGGGGGGGYSCCTPTWSDDPGSATQLSEASGRSPAHVTSPFVGVRPQSLEYFSRCVSTEGAPTTTKAAGDAGYILRVGASSYEMEPMPTTFKPSCQPILTATTSREPAFFPDMLGSREGHAACVSAIGGCGVVMDMGTARDRSFISAEEVVGGQLSDAASVPGQGAGAYRASSNAAEIATAVVTAATVGTGKTQEPALTDIGADNKASIKEAISNGNKRNNTRGAQASYTRVAVAVPPPPPPLAGGNLGNGRHGRSHTEPAVDGCINNHVNDARAGESRRSGALPSVTPIPLSYGTSVPVELVYRLTGGTGSHMSMAPEVYQIMPYNEKADVFSFAILLYELFSRSLLLFTHLNTRRPGLPFTIHNVEQFADAVSRGYRPPRLACIPDLVWAVISDCWQSDPLLRPPMTAVVEQLHSIREHWEKAASATAGEGEGGSRSIGGRIIDSFTFTCLRGGRGGDGSCEGVRRSRSPRVELKVKGCRDCVIC